MRPQEFVKRVDDAVAEFLGGPEEAEQARESLLDDPELAAAAREGFESNPAAQMYAQAYAAGAAEERKRADAELHPLLAAAVIERRRQVNHKAYTPEHDDSHRDAELARAGAVYALTHAPMDERAFWPWAMDKFQPSRDIVDNLAKSVALLMAEFDRLSRLTGRGGR